MMQTHTLFLTGPDNNRLCVQTDIPDNPQGLAFIAHGLAGFKEENCVQIPKAVFLSLGYTVITYDARFSFGASDGDLENACFTNFIADLNTVIDWAKQHRFFKTPFILCGHSLGGGACLDYAIRFPDQIQALFLLSVVYNGTLLLSSYQHTKPDFVCQWQETGFLDRTKASDSLKQGRISYQHIVDACRYHLEQTANKVTAPTCLICSDRDISSTIQINRILLNALHSQKSLTVIPNARHAFDTSTDATALYDALHQLTHTLV